MDFARQQLEKYGWRDGEGLGKNKNGVADPIKAKLKFDNSGLGHNIADEIVNPWWQRVYDTAAINLNVLKDKDSIKIETQGETEVTTKRRKSKKSNNSKEKYGNFVKRAALTWKGEHQIGSDEDIVDDEPKNKKSTSGICDLTDEELFKACGGRTVHKGARHGLSMSAKLERSARLEKEALKRLKSKEAENEIEEDRTGEEIFPKKKSKKRKN